MGDELRYTQILLNFLSNAIKFSETDGIVTASVNVVKGNKYRIAVNNRGNVLPPSEKTKLLVEL